MQQATPLDPRGGSDGIDALPEILEGDRGRLFRIAEDVGVIETAFARQPFRIDRQPAALAEIRAAGLTAAAGRRNLPSPKVFISSSRWKDEIKREAGADPPIQSRRCPAAVCGNERRCPTDDGD